jgi:hypothetical protein
VSTHPARRLWAALETLHDVTYFAPEVRSTGIGQGLKGFWMTYFAWRAAPLGPVPAAPVVAMFAGFHPGTVARALPGAWSRTTPRACLEARAAVSTAALRDAGADPEACGRAAAALAPVAAAADPTGRPLGAANAALELPGDPLGGIWQLATTLREHRGDGHIAAMVNEGITGLEAHLQPASQPRRVPLEQLPQRDVVAPGHGGDQRIVVHRFSIASWRHLVRRSGPDDVCAASAAD